MSSACAPAFRDTTASSCREARCLHRAGTIGVSIRETGRFTPVRVRHTIRNRWLTVLMLYQAGTLLRFAPALAVFEVLQLLGAVRKGWLGHWLWAAGSTVRMLPHVLRVRRAMRTSRRRGDLEILTRRPLPLQPRDGTAPRWSARRSAPST